jgi:NhaP-type Na+/H+ or K+/H+ antiporter
MAVGGAEVVFIFLFLSLFIGAITTYVLSRMPFDIPYTVVVFAIGMIFSTALQNPNKHDLLKLSMEMWDKIDPHLIFYIFLPALLFGEAMSLSFHQVRSAFISASLIAGPGAVFGTFALASLVHYSLPYGWSWDTCFVLGAILSATDPVGK